MQEAKRKEAGGRKQEAGGRRQEAVRMHLDAQRAIPGHARGRLRRLCSRLRDDRRRMGPRGGRSMAWGGKGSKPLAVVDGTHLQRIPSHSGETVDTRPP